MQQENITPNEVTFLSILKACSVAGLVEEAVRMKRYASSRVCHVHRLLKHGVHCLNANKIYKNVEMAKLASRKMVELEANNDGAYVELSKGVDGVRHKMKSKDVLKILVVIVIDSS
uniref:Uncharacterized protein n=1 Tax=Lactuca sativa TaxID=4236 RepID=A0A9R1UX13_LACSA|nr:hypothetical protein LSAT_V11C700386840 [Lactuca sativa]